MEAIFVPIMMGICPVTSVVGAAVFGWAMRRIIPTLRGRDSLFLALAWGVPFLLATAVVAPLVAATPSDSEGPLYLIGVAIVAVTLPLGVWLALRRAVPRFHIGWAIAVAALWVILSPFFVITAPVFSALLVWIVWRAHRGGQPQAEPQPV